MCLFADVNLVEILVQKIDQQEAEKGRMVVLLVIPHRTPAMMVPHALLQPEPGVDVRFLRCRMHFYDRDNLPSLSGGEPNPDPRAC